MTLVELKDRRSSLDANITQITQNLYMLHGHRAEVEFQISELEKEAASCETPEPQEQEETIVE